MKKIISVLLFFIHFEIVLAQDSLKLGTIEEYQSGQEPDPNGFYAFDEHIEVLNFKEIVQKIRSVEQVQNIKNIKKVKIKVLVDENGNYVKHLVDHSEDEFLLHAVEKNIVQLKFKPAKINKKNAKAWVHMAFTNQDKSYIVEYFSLLFIIFPAFAFFSNLIEALLKLIYPKISFNLLDIFSQEKFKIFRFVFLLTTSIGGLATIYLFFTKFKFVEFFFVLFLIGVFNLVAIDYWKNGSESQLTSIFKFNLPYFLRKNK